MEKKKSSKNTFENDFERRIFVKKEKQQNNVHKSEEGKKFDFLSGWKALNPDPPVVRDDNKNKGNKNK